MKKIIVILICSFAIMLPGACNQPEPIDNAYTLLYGTWKLTATATDDNLNGVLDAAEIQSLPGYQSELLKFNSDSTGNQHTTYNTVVADYAFTWSYQKSYTVLQTVFNAHDTIVNHVDDLTLTGLTIRTYDSIYNSHTVVASWKIYKKNQ